jgi:hypothetical protein
MCNGQEKRKVGKDEHIHAPRTRMNRERGRAGVHGLEQPTLHNPLSLVRLARTVRQDNASRMDKSSSLVLCAAIWWILHAWTKTIKAKRTPARRRRARRPNEPAACVAVGKEVHHRFHSISHRRRRCCRVRVSQRSADRCSSRRWGWGGPACGSARVNVRRVGCGQRLEEWNCRAR